MGIRQTVGGEHIHAALFAGHIPGFAGTQMIHQGLVALLHNNTNIMDAGILQAGESDINESVSSAERQRCAGAVCAQLSQFGEGMVGINYSVNILHFATSMLS